ncbi:hypothetical protein E4U41_001708 [Claviceps citrina]|nr:hypothetical protein E4U41_001708 [Claviceps citrina]
MVKPLTFKGDRKKKPKKRRRDDADPSSSSRPQAELDDPHRDADADGNDNDDSWVSAEAAADVVGPVMIVLPTEGHPSALACDATGKVFAQRIENIVDGNPSSAEPHDVRMVWVANRVAGTEHVRFKGHHRRYLACDATGSLSATSEAVSPLECFNVLATPDHPGTFQLQTLRETLLTLRPSDATTKSSPARPPAEELRGDEPLATGGSSTTTMLRIRMQARFKPRLRASREEKALAKISRRALEEAAGRRLDEDEVRVLKRARREGDYHEKLLDLKVKNRHDKFG